MTLCDPIDKWRPVVLTSEVNFTKNYMLLYLYLYLYRERQYILDINVLLFQCCRLQQQMMMTLLQLKMTLARAEMHQEPMMRSLKGKVGGKSCSRYQHGVSCDVVYCRRRYNS